MQITAIDRKRSAQDEKSLRETLQIQRERKLWSFLTWAFLLAQIAIAEKLFGSSAQAAIDEKAPSEGSGLADGEAGTAGNIADVAGFTGENAGEGAAEAPGDAGRFELSSKVPDATLPEIGSQTDSNPTGLTATITSNSGGAQPSLQQHSAVPASPDSPDTPVAALPGADLPGIVVIDPDLSLPDLVDGVTGTVFDLLDTTITLDLSLDTVVITSLLDQLGVDLNLSLDLAADLNTLGLGTDVADTVSNTVDDLLSSVASTPLLASITDPLNGFSITGDLIPADPDALFDSAFANADSIVAGAVDTVDDVTDSVQPALSALGDQAGDALATLAFTTSDLLGNVADMAGGQATDVASLDGTVGDLLPPIADVPIMASLADTFGGVSQVADLAPGNFDALFDDAFASAATVADGVQPFQSAANDSVADEVSTVSINTADILGGVDDATGSVNDLLAADGDVPIMGSISDTPTIDSLAQNDMDSLFDGAFSGGDSGDAVQTALSDLGDQSGDATAPEILLTTADLLNALAEPSSVAELSETASTITGSITSLLAADTGVNASADAESTQTASADIGDDDHQNDGAALDLSAQAGSQLLDLANDHDSGGGNPLITLDLSALITGSSPDPTSQTPSQNVDDYSTSSGEQSEYMLALNTPEEDQIDEPSSQESFTQSLPLIGDALHQDEDDEDLSELGVVDDTQDITASLIDDLPLTKGWGLGLWG